MRSEILTRYAEQRLPRYTSYPTAPHFSEMVDARTYRRWLSQVPADAEASLYLHIPFCRSMCWYCGCHTTITRHDGPVLDYLDAMRREIAAVSSALAHPLGVGHVHFGGGTPTLLRPEDFLTLMDLLRDRFRLRPDAEVAVEIDPRTLTPAMTAALGAAGVTRASLGVQSFDPTVQRAINRIQSFEQTAEVTNGLRAAGVGGINFDLIYGLPHQTVASCLDTVARCLELRPDRFAVFGYAYVPGFKPHQRKIDETVLPAAAERHAQAEAIAEALGAAGYRRIGLDHFAHPDDPMSRASDARTLHRNFQGYTTDRGDLLLGFGASAIGRLPQGYVQNAVVLGSYAKRIQAGELATIKGFALSEDDRLRAELIERIMCDFSVDLGAVCARHGRDAASFVADLPGLDQLVTDGVAMLEGGSIRVPESARPLVRAVAACFDAHLPVPGRRHAPAV
ncbi:oxygen-independent coproporphyrinogen III oxidase [Arenibaculum sp.]|jgi:oxygen-independent coproporphyrinogen-3 oxidase|uniref:oxygen-independent coproporphyrinogen III oxidase n=1 Tax=Arenibaculum sp. TaxID=2865862 RepID=UPI002E167E4D|nr:oxygen-independent coproporphyrinogen III oxidase [Arenibaculum sp.]